MEEKFIYKPYHAQGIFAYIIMAFILMETVLLGILVSDFFTSKEAIVFLLVEGCVMILAHFMISLSKVMIVFEAKGLTVINDRQIECHFVEWNSFRYAYYAKSYKGHNFLVLSPEELGKKEVDKFVRKGTNSSKVCVDNAIVIYLGFLKDTSKITEFVEQRVRTCNTGND